MAFIALSLALVVAVPAPGKARPQERAIASPTPSYPGPFYVWFAAGSDAPGPATGELLDRLARDGAFPRACGPLLVDGHSDASDGAARGLGRRRAEAVAAALRARGLRERIRIRDLGASRPFPASGDEAGPAMNRRVEILPACLATTR